MMGLALILVIVFVNFYLLTSGRFKVHVGMMIAMLAGLTVVGYYNPEEVPHLLSEGFAGYSRVIVLFTAIAVPSHVLYDSRFFEEVGLTTGMFIGALRERGNFWKRVPTSLIVIAIGLSATYIMAGLFHNTTSILVSAGIIVSLCLGYHVPAIPVLSGALVASNLGGFSTRWGDTPNIVEAATWGLNHSDFFTQITPINIGLLVLLIGATYLVTQITMRRNDIPEVDTSDRQFTRAAFELKREQNVVDRSHALIGGSSLAIAVLVPIIFPAFEIPASTLAIVICTIAARDKAKTLFSLGGETYATLLAIFVLSEVLAESSIGIGDYFTTFLASSDASILSITLASYAGTLLTEAASWATAASDIVHSLDSTNVAAWALGSGICAGSSSLVTAATAGVILLGETKDNPEHARMSFRDYLFFGLPFSLFMLLYYNLVLWLVF